ncbi:hypothetical protein FHW69_001996 [Luteibacter sp. Sphag1AF]|uniref:tetratricopeptide repeat protein n=1 Tax=Luteibacter sp. Sphag1AF TaxID=2587031 RepID=UPI00160C09BF|nr:tetratricopeptide repeat protein [Luteibacter sp. Sphag1AF]MBB3227373.1 hypothetical protein [Luteibacter sp. Sphag1AF]
MAFDPAELKACFEASDEQARAYVTEHARTGDVTAQTVLGQMCLDGTGGAVAPTEGLYWFQQAAHQHSPMAMNMVGRCYENGWGAPIDYELAAVWFRRAAEANLDWGVYNYAHLLANGRGMPQDRAAAFTWFGRAAAMGHARTKNFLAQYHENGWETPVDPDKARELYRQSAEAGDYRGECSWASVLAGEGRLNEAETFLKRAIAKAPPHFLEALADTLARSPHERFRKLL